MSAIAKPSEPLLGSMDEGTKSPLLQTPPWLEDPTVRALARFLTNLDRFLSGLPFSTFCVLVLTAVVLQNGLWVVPIIDEFRSRASDLTHQVSTLNPSNDYIYSSFLGLLLGYWTGAWKSVGAFAFLHLASLLIGLIWLLWLARRKLGDQGARILALTFATVPLSNVLLTWLGMSDVYVFIFSTAIVLSESSLAILTLAFLLGLAHFEQGLVIACGLSIIRLYREFKGTSSWWATMLSTISLLGGVVAARLFLNRYFFAHGFHITHTRLAFFEKTPLTRFLYLDAHHFATLVFSFYGCFWLVVLAVTYSLWRLRRDAIFGILGAHVMFISLAMLTLDETRIFIILAWPFLVFFLTLNLVPLASIWRYVVLACLFGFLIPKLIVWQGSVHSGALCDGIILLVRVVTDHGAYHDPGWMELPFRH